MSKRNYALDYIRVVAILMIVMCHYCFFSSLDSGIGRYLAGVGNMIFFMLSALLYGNRCNYAKTATMGGSNLQHLDCHHFICKRIIKLGASVWPFLVVLTLLFLIFDIKFSWIDVGLNFAFLGYLGKLPGNGHLWFLTVIMCCYAEYMLFDRLQIRKKWFPWILLVGSIAVMAALESIGIPGNAFAILGFFGFLLMKADRFMRTARELNLWMILIIVVINASLLWLDIEGLFEKSRIIHYLACDICGCLLLALFIRMMPDKENKFIMFLSGISFEIYVVHHTLCAGPMVRIPQMTESHILNFIVLLAVAFVLAIVLHWVASMLNSFLLKITRNV